MLKAQRKTESVGTLPTALSSMMPWALVRAAAEAADMLAFEPKKRRRNEMVSEKAGRRGGFGVGSVFELKGDGNGNDETDSRLGWGGFISCFW